MMSEPLQTEKPLNYDSWFESLPTYKFSLESITGNQSNTLQSKIDKSVVCSSPNIEILDFLSDNDQNSDIISNRIKRCAEKVLIDLEVASKKRILSKQCSSSSTIRQLSRESSFERKLETIVEKGTSQNSSVQTDSQKSMIDSESQYDDHRITESPKRNRISLKHQVFSSPFKTPDRIPNHIKFKRLDTKFDDSVAVLQENIQKGLEKYPLKSNVIQSDSANHLSEKLQKSMKMQSSPFLDKTSKVLALSNPKQTPHKIQRKYQRLNEKFVNFETHSFYSKEATKTMKEFVVPMSPIVKNQNWNGNSSGRIMNRTNSENLNSMGLKTVGIRRNLSNNFSRQRSIQDVVVGKSNTNRQLVFNRANSKE